MLLSPSAGDSMSAQSSKAIRTIVGGKNTLPHIKNTLKVLHERVKNPQVNQPYNHSNNHDNRYIIRLNRGKASQVFTVEWWMEVRRSCK